MKNFRQLIWLVIFVISAFAGLICASGRSGLGEQGAPKDNNEAGEPAYKTYAAVSTDLLKRYEADYENFKGLEIADKIVYFQQRKLEEAIVQRDYILYQFDKKTQELLDVKFNWREDLPDKLPGIISKDNAEASVEGQVQYSGLFYICPDSAVFPIKPAPTNPCWVVETLINNRIDVVVIDAVKGEILGHGVPPPSYTAFSCTGPQNDNPQTCSCSGEWEPWYENARNWFNTMGYNTEGTIWPTRQKVMDHIQSNATALFYELAHGGDWSFGPGYDYNNCTMDWINAKDIENWIAGYEKMPFAFLGSCDGMCNTNNDTLSYEFRKGSNENTATVGYCGMSGSNCSNFCWYADYTIPWQSLLFNCINQGWTVKAAFDQANASYPGCANYNCMRFAGDEDFCLVPVIERLPSEIQAAIDAASDGDTIIIQPGVYYGRVDFKGKNLTLRSTDPNDSAVVAATVIDGKNTSPVVNFSQGEDANCVLAGFKITGGENMTEQGAVSCSGAGTSPTISKCIIAKNAGRGIYCAYSSPKITNCIVAGNKGTGIEVWSRNSIEIANCTIAENGNNGISAYGSGLVIKNCIIWGNQGEEIYRNPYVSYTDIDGGHSGSNTLIGNIDIDPLFVRNGYWDTNGTPADPNDDFWVEGDYHLKSQGWRWDTQYNVWTWDDVTSRCIDAGNPGSPLGGELLYVPDDPNNVRGQNLRIDMGAFGGTAEASIPPYDWALLADLTNDGIVDLADYAYQAADWLNSADQQPGDLNRDGLIDTNDLALLTNDWLVQTSWH